MNPLAMLFMNREAGAGRGLVVPPMGPVQVQGPGARLRGTSSRRAPAAAPQLPVPGLYAQPTHEENMAALEAAMAQDSLPAVVPDPGPLYAPNTHEGNMAALEEAMRSPAATPAAQDPGILARVKGFLGSVEGRQDKDAIYNGMVQAGVGLLGSGGNVAKGLAEGFGGFNEGYAQTQAAQKAANTPKLTPLANGAFTMLTYPNGQQRVVPNSEVQQYLEGVENNKFTREQLAAGLKSAREGSVAGSKAAIKTGEEARGAAQTARASLEKYGKALEIASRQGTGAQLQSLPGVSGVAQFLGTDAAKDNLAFTDLAVDETLLRTAQLKGAITEKEIALLKSPIPNPSADRQSVWKPWIEERIAVVQKMIANLEADAARGEAAAGGAPVVPPPAAPGSGGKFNGQVPGLSPGAMKYL